MLKANPRISLRSLLLFALLTGAVCGIAGSYWRASIYKPVRVIATWSGKVPEQRLRNIWPSEDCASEGCDIIWPAWLDDERSRIEDPLQDVPQIGLVCDAESWDAIWGALSGGEALRIDFNSELVIVVIAPNLASVEGLTRNGLRDVKGKLWFYAADIGLCYVFLKIPRPEVRTFNGTPVPRLDLRLKKN